MDVVINATAQTVLDNWKNDGRVKKYGGLNVADLEIISVYRLIDGDGADYLIMIEEGDDAVFECDFARELNRILDVDVAVRVEW